MQINVTVEIMTEGLWTNERCSNLTKQIDSITWTVRSYIKIYYEKSVKRVFLRWMGHRYRKLDDCSV
jgi:hypothetical protein